MAVRLNARRKSDEILDRSPLTPHPSSPTMRLLPAALGLTAAMAVFYLRFEPGLVQWGVDALWVLGLVFWIVLVRQLGGDRLLGAWPSREKVWPLAVFLLLFAIAWLPFYDDWRWAYTGDSVSWFAVGAVAAKNGLAHNLLSLHGVDGHFTYLHSLAFNSLLFIFEPTLFWHRVGKLIASCVSLSAIYAYFTMTLGRWAALAIVAAVATNYVWLWFSYVSYGHIDTYTAYFLSLACAVSIWRQPDRIGTWMICGLIGGLSLFFTQTAWSAVLAVGIFLGAFALLSRRILAAVVYGVSFVLTAIPVLLQLPGLLRMTARQAGVVFDWNYLSKIFSTILQFAYQSPYDHIGVHGAFLRPPLTELYLVGGALAAVAALPPARRLLRIPAIAPVLLAMLLWDAALMALTNNAYGMPSTKRAFALIPIQVFLALLPLLVAHSWLARWATVGRVATSLVVVVLAVYAAGSFRVLAEPPPGLYGTNTFDGLIELRQRFPERGVLLVTTRPEYVRDLREDSFFHEAYRLADRVATDERRSGAAVERACAEQRLLCYEAHMEPPFIAVVEAHSHRLETFPLLNSKELRCFECRASLDD